MTQVLFIPLFFFFLVVLSQEKDSKLIYKQNYNRKA